MGYTGPHKRHHVPSWNDKVFTCGKNRNKGTACEVDVAKVSCMECLVKLDVSLTPKTLPHQATDGLKAAIRANRGHLEVRAVLQPETGGYVEVRCYSKGNPNPFIEIKLADISPESWGRALTAIGRAVSSP